MAIFNSELLVYQRVYTNYWLVVEPTPLKNMSSSNGIIVPIYGKIVFFPNHQPDGIYTNCYQCMSVAYRLPQYLDTIIWGYDC